LVKNESLLLGGKYKKGHTQLLLEKYFLPYQERYSYHWLQHLNKFSQLLLQVLAEKTPLELPLPTWA